MQQLEHLSDREMLISLLQEVRQVNSHLITQNGRLAKVEGAQQTQGIKIAEVAGAVGFGKWALATILAMMMAGAALAGIILAVVSRA